MLPPRPSVRHMAAIRILQKLNRMLMVFAAFWAFFLAVTITLDVSGRGLFNQPLTGTHELIVNSVVMIVFLQVAYAVSSGSMLRADFLLHLFPVRLKQALNIVGYLGGTAIFALIVYGCFEPMIQAFERGEYEGDGALRVPVWPIYCVIILGALLACLSYLAMLWQEISGWRNADV